MGGRKYTSKRGGKVSRDNVSESLWKEKSFHQWTFGNNFFHKLRLWSIDGQKLRNSVGFDRYNILYTKCMLLIQYKGGNKSENICNVQQNEVKAKNGTGTRHLMV